MRAEEGSEGEKVRVIVTRLCLTLCNPMDCIPPGSSVPEIIQARILEWVAIPFSGPVPSPGDLSDPWIERSSPALQADSFFKYKFIYFNWRLITLQYCIGFLSHQGSPLKQRFLTKTVTYKTRLPEFALKG